MTLQSKSLIRRQTQGRRMTISETVAEIQVAQIKAGQKQIEGKMLRDTKIIELVLISEHYIVGDGKIDNVSLDFQDGQMCKLLQFTDREIVGMAG